MSQSQSEVREWHEKVAECLMSQLRLSHPSDPGLFSRLLSLTGQLQRVASLHVDVLIRFRATAPANLELPPLYVELFSADTHCQ